jgi:hypothetical protein
MRASLLLAVAITSCPFLQAAGPAQTLIDQTFRITDIDARQSQPLVEQLQREIDRILQAGPLAPLRLAYGDIAEPHDGEVTWLYYEPGRVITTMGWAWCHLDARRQAQVRAHVRKLLADPKHAPWATGIKASDAGKSRNLSGRAIHIGKMPPPSRCPTVHVLYGLWLYGHRSGQWQDIQPHWPKIRKRYLAALDDETFLLGQISAHLGAARMARRFGDDATAGRAAEALQADLQAASDPARLIRRTAETRWGVYLQPRRKPFFPGQPWLLLDACPEVLRWYAKANPGDAEDRIEKITARYPHWYLAAAGYYTRWTGDESIGTTPELMGMVLPVKRWILGESAKTLRGYMRSVPVGIGDCYWIESLVMTIEAHGRCEWGPLDP